MTRSDFVAVALICPLNFKSTVSNVEAARQPKESRRSLPGGNTEERSYERERDACESERRAKRNAPERMAKRPPNGWQSVGSAETNCRTVLAVGRTHVRSKLGYIWKTGLQFASERSVWLLYAVQDYETAMHLNTLGTQVAFHRLVVSALSPLAVSARESVGSNFGGSQRRR